MEISVKINTDDFKRSLEEKGKAFDTAIQTAKNMIASMMRTQMEEDIRSAGNFGDRYLDGLSVTVEGDTITTMIDAPGADIFETGGTIHGNPLLWLPLSGTDAEGIRVSDYGDKLFSVNRKAGGPPLLFSIKDRAPKYFGVPSVNIPQKFHLKEVQERVMGELPKIFEAALKDSGDV